MIHFMNLNPAPFKMIKAGDKTVEMRLYDEKRRGIKAGDIIEFKNNENGEKLNLVVKVVRVFKNFEELYNNYSPRVLGYVEGETAMPGDMLAYYSAADIERYGVAAIELLL